MSLSLHTIVVQSTDKMLDNLTRLLEKAEAHAQARKFDAAVLLNARLAPDMFPLTRQIQIASDAVKGVAARLAGKDVPSWPDTETTFDDLKARIAKTREFLASLKPEDFEGGEARDITIPTRARGDLHFKGKEYLLNFALPNFFFHVTTAYAILRHNGVELGKLDYLGG